MSTYEEAWEAARKMTRTIMNKAEPTVIYTPKHFTIEEVVPPEMLKFHKVHRLWRIFDANLLKTVDLLKEHFNTNIIINDYNNGGTLRYRGYRNFTYYINTELNKAAFPFSDKNEVLQWVQSKKNLFELSQHQFGRAIDCNFDGLNTEEVRQEILNNHDKFIHIGAIEKDVSWLHFDTRPRIKANEIFVF